MALASLVRSGLRSRGSLLFPLRVAPMQQVLGAGTAQMRAAILHHHLAVDVAGAVGNQETGEIRELAMFADTSQWISRCRPFVAALGVKLARCARGRKRTGCNRHGADTLRSPFHRE